jgi:hypothetical protein
MSKDYWERLGELFVSMAQALAKVMLPKEMFKLISTPRSSLKLWTSLA